MIVDDPETLAEVTAAFRAYEAAFVANDVETLDRFFWDDGRTVRYGVADIQHGREAIRRWRRTQSGADLARTLADTVITSFGRDFATASTLFRRASGPGQVGRQMQTWVRTAGGWRVVAAHVSVIDDPA